LHLPHWLTSNKAHMDCSEISSLPDLSYPAWIQCCDFGEPELWDEPVRHSFHLTASRRFTSSWFCVPGAPPPGASRVEAPCWVSDLEKDEALKEAPAQIEGEQNLRDVRLQLAEQISALAAEGGGSHSLAALFRGRNTNIHKLAINACWCDLNPSLLSDNRIQALIQKADQNQFPFSGSELAHGFVPVKPAERELKRFSLFWFLSQVPGCCFHGNTTWKQPGPVEAVKQMLFRLQAVKAELQRGRIDTDCPGTPEKQVESPGLDTTAAEPLSNLNVHI
ncbi:hypothetical protein GOODEAATRI_006778, partial [Goodea atripinnis]